jgi:uncharacterized protein YggE
MKAGVRNALMGVAIILVGANATGAFAQGDAMYHLGGPSSVVVTGYGKAERVAEEVHIIAEARGRAADAAAALKAAGEQRDKLLSLAGRVQAAESASAAQTGFDVSPVLQADCARELSFAMGGNHVAGCRVEGFDATIRITFGVRPAKAAGALAALLIESGANNVSVDSNDFDDHPDLDRAALTAAFADARTRAEQLAVAGGAHLGRVISVVHGVSSATPEGYQYPPRPQSGDQGAIALRLPKPPDPPLTPQTALDLQPPKVHASTSVIVTFEWLK